MPTVDEVNRALLDGSLLLTQSGLPVIGEPLPTAEVPEDVPQQRMIKIGGRLRPITLREHMDWQQVFLFDTPGQYHVMRVAVEQLILQQVNLRWLHTVKIGANIVDASIVIQHDHRDMYQIPLAMASYRDSSMRIPLEFRSGQHFTVMIRNESRPMVALPYPIYVEVLGTEVRTLR